MLVIGPTARRIAAGCCNYILTRFPPGHDVPVCTIDQEWFADLAQKEIAASQEDSTRLGAAAARLRRYYAGEVVYMGPDGDGNFTGDVLILLDAVAPR